MRLYQQPRSQLGPRSKHRLRPPGGAPLYRVPAAGGVPQPLTKLDSGQGERAHGWPEFLPGGKALLFASLKGSSWWEAQIVVLSLESGERRVLVEGGTQPRYAASGHLVFARDDGLLAVPFELATLRVKGTPVRVLEGAGPSRVNGMAPYSLSRDGLLAYLPRGGSLGLNMLVWVDRKGVARPVIETRFAYHCQRISPDGRRLVYVDRNDLWVYDVARETSTRLTFEGVNHWHAWSPDGKRIAYSKSHGGAWHIVWKPATAAGRKKA